MPGGAGAGKSHVIPAFYLKAIRTLLCEGEKSSIRSDHTTNWPMTIGKHLCQTPRAADPHHSWGVHGSDLLWVMDQHLHEIILNSASSVLGQQTTQLIHCMFLGAMTRWTSLIKGVVKATREHMKENDSWQRNVVCGRIIGQKVTHGIQEDCQKL